MVESVSSQSTWDGGITKSAEAKVRSACQFLLSHPAAIDDKGRVNGGPSARIGPRDVDAGEFEDGMKRGLDSCTGTLRPIRRRRSLILVRVAQVRHRAVLQLTWCSHGLQAYSPMQSINIVKTWAPLDGYMDCHFRGPSPSVVSEASAAFIVQLAARGLAG